MNALRTRTVWGGNQGYWPGHGGLFQGLKKGKKSTFWLTCVRVPPLKEEFSSWTVLHHVS